MKKLLCVLMFGMMFGQAELTTRVYDFPDNFLENQYVDFSLSGITNNELSDNQFATIDVFGYSEDSYLNGSLYIDIRKELNDWDFSEEARLRQAKRMSEYADKHIKEGYHVVADFICPLPKSRELFNADYTVWVDTIKAGRFDDTNAMFIKPKKYDCHVTTQNAKEWAAKIAKEIK